jgi:hypothetical protein
MERAIHTLIVSAWLTACTPALAGQVPGAASDPDIPISHRDRVYSAEQFSNTVSVTDPFDNKLLGVIRLGDPLPANLSPLYRGPVAGARPGVLAGSSNHRSSRDRLECRDLHRYRDQLGQARHLRRAFAT